MPAIRYASGVFIAVFNTEGHIEMLVQGSKLPWQRWPRRSRRTRKRRRRAKDTRERPVRPRMGAFIASVHAAISA